MPNYILGESFSAQYFDGNGDPAVNHTFEFFITGTSTPAAVAFDSAGTSTATMTTVGTNGFQRNGSVQVNVYFDDAVTYDIVRKDSGGAPFGPTVVGFTVPSPEGDGAQSVVAAGTSAPDVIAADITPAPTTLVGQQVVVELTHGANTITTPTFNLNGLGAVTIVRDTNDPLVVGDTGGVGYKLQLNYSDALSAWVLINAAKQTTQNYAPGSVDTAAIALDAIVTNRIADDQITIDKMGNLSVDTPQLVDDAVTNGKIADDAVDTDQIADNAVGTSQIATNAIVTNRIADDQVNNDKLANMPAMTIKGNDDVVATGPMDLTASEVKTLLSPIVESISTTAQLFSVNNTDPINPVLEKRFARARSRRSSSVEIDTVINAADTPVELTVDNVFSVYQNNVTINGVDDIIEFSFNESETSAWDLHAVMCCKKATGGTDQFKFHWYLDDFPVGGANGGNITAEFQSGDRGTVVLEGSITNVAAGPHTVTVYVENEDDDADLDTTSMTATIERIF